MLRDYGVAKVDDDNVHMMPNGVNPQGCHRTWNAEVRTRSTPLGHGRPSVAATLAGDGLVHCLRSMEKMPV